MNYPIGNEFVCNASWLVLYLLHHDLFSMCKLFQAGLGSPQSVL